MLLTHDKWENPIIDERDWPIFNVTTAKLPVYGNTTWTVIPDYLKDGTYTAKLVFTKADEEGYDDIKFTFKNAAEDQEVSAFLKDLTKIDAPDIIVVLPGPCDKTFPDTS